MHAAHFSAGEPLHLHKGVLDVKCPEIDALKAQALDQITEAVIITDSELSPPGPTILYVNAAFCRLSGYSAEEVLGKTPRLLQGPRTDRDVLDRLKSTLLAGESFRGSTFNYKKDGTEYEVEWRVYPVCNSEGQITYFVSLQRDVTRERDLERKLQQFLQSNLLGIVFIDMKTGKISQANEFFCHLTGYQMNEVIGRMSLSQITPVEYLEADQSAHDQIMASQVCQPYEKELICRSGKRIHVIYGASVAGENKGDLLGFFLDNSSRHAAEASLMESHQRLEQMVEKRTAELRLMFERQAALSRLDVESVNTEDDLHNFFNEVKQVLKSHLPADGEISLQLVGTDQSFSDDIPSPAMEAVKRCCPVILDHAGSEQCPSTLGFIGVPLVDRDEVLGVLYACSNLCMNYGARDVEFMNALARRASAAIVKQRLLTSLRHQNEVLASEVRAKATAEEALAKAIRQAQAARAEAEAANAAKSDFLSRMSHELRTPLNAVLGFAQLMELRASNDDDRLALGHIIAGGRHLLNLINEVLDISRIESGRLEVTLQPVPIFSLAKQCLDMFSSQIEEAGLKVQWCGPWNHDVRAIGDPQRLRQIFINLLSNAIKYNRKGGAITLRLNQDKSQYVCLSIADEGIGISKEHMSRLFVPFDRLGAELLGIEGVGLGLSLTRQLVHALGGEILIDSAEHRGTLVTLKLLAFQEVKDDLVGGVQISAESALPLLDHPRNETTHILYIEDNLSNVRLIQRMVETISNIRLIHAFTGKEGLQLAEIEQPDLILLDLHLPDINGIDVLKLLKQESVTASIPVVILSADATEGSMNKLQEYGAAYYLTKPLDVRKLSAILRHILDGR